jgi:hypothetical protein
MLALTSNGHDIAFVVCRVDENEPDKFEESIRFDNKYYVEDVYSAPFIQIIGKSQISEKSYISEIKSILKKWSKEVPSIKFDFQPQFPNEKQIKFWVLNAFRNIALPEWYHFNQNFKEWNFKEIVSQIPLFVKITGESHFVI